MPGALWARERVRARFLNHRYTRVPRGQIASPPAAPDALEDDWGNPLPVQDPDAGAPGTDAGASCLYIDAGAYLPTPQGPIQVTDPTLLVAYDDPIAVGDLVRNVVNPGTSELLLAEARVETITVHSPKTAPMWRIVGLRHDQVI